MGSNKEYLEYVLDQLSDLEDITYRAMMGEYIIYYQGKIIGGIYDDRFLLKPVKSAISMMPDVKMELPYDGAKEMLLVEDLEDKDFLAEVIEAMYDELPSPRKRK
ncbi:TfoX/Sxy family protein [Methanobrevibacter sp.]|uniref:TfoX/Sxy family protein n=1 Tax=Methanobrevibacter sp. TaxID=66852 RepID=UPI00388EBBFD